MTQNKTRSLTFAGMMIAVGIILPFAVSHGFGVPGTVLLPMHIPVFLIGLLCGPLYGASCGILIPALNTLLTGMPAAFPMLPIMGAELFTSGLLSGILFYRTPLNRFRFGVYPALAGSMLCGRVAYGLMFWALNSAFGQLKALSVWGAVTTGLPGIVVQLLLVPAIVSAVRYQDGAAARLLDSAKILLEEGRVACIVMRNGKILRTETGNGIAPMISLYESGALRDSIVADRVVGKAAAMILCLGGARYCYGRVMSRTAREYLESPGIAAAYGVLTDHIENRTGDGICPMEQAVSAFTDGQQALCALKEKLAELQGNAAAETIQTK